MNKALADGSLTPRPKPAHSIFEGVSQKIAKGAVRRGGDHLETMCCRSCSSVFVGEHCPVCGSFKLVPATPEAMEMAGFIGPNYEFYLSKWWKTRFGQAGLLTWNWPAFLVGVNWLAYRKMYGWVAVYSAIEVFSVILAGFVASNLARLLFDAALILTLSLTGNWLYYRHVCKKINALRKVFSEDQINSELSQAGGVSLFAVVIFIVLKLALLLGYYLI